MHTHPSLTKVFYKLSMSNYKRTRNLGNSNRVDDVDILGTFDWCSKVLDSLMESKQNWIKDRNSRNFTGPLVFLIILYVDRVVYKSKRSTQRGCPSFIGWTDSLLRERSAEELKYNSFGRGIISNSQYATLLLKNEDEANMSSTLGLLEYTIAEENIEQDLVQNLEISALELVKAVRRYNANMTACKALIVDNLRVNELGLEIENFVKTIVGSAYTNGMEENNKKWSDKKEDGSKKKNAVQMDDIYTDTIANNEASISRQCAQAPTFSLGCNLTQDTTLKPKNTQEIWSEVCDIAKFYNTKEIDKPEGSKPINVVRSTAFKQPSSNVGDELEQETEQQIISRRETRPSDAKKSPFIKRMLDINLISSMDQKRTCNWFLMGVEPNEEILFKWGNMKTTSKEVATLKKDNYVSDGVIDSWACILNNREELRSQRSPHRFFMPVTMTEMNTTEEGRYALFRRNINAVWELFPRIKFEKIDMVFFPVLQSLSNFYIICYNIKNPSWEIIDNDANHSENDETYQDYLFSLHVCFTRYLEEIRHPKLEVVKNLMPVRLEMKWKTKNNEIDCGVFVMRHMERYMGEGKKEWDCQLTSEGAKQKRQLNRLRTLYIYHILTCPCNEEGSVNFFRAEEFYTKKREQIKKEKKLIEKKQLETSRRKKQ